MRLALLVFLGIDDFGIGDIETTCDLFDATGERGREKDGLRIDAAPGVGRSCYGSRVCLVILDWFAVLVQFVLDLGRLFSGTLLARMNLEILS